MTALDDIAERAAAASPSKGGAGLGRRGGGRGTAGGERRRLSTCPSPRRPRTGREKTARPTLEPASSRRSGNGPIPWDSRGGSLARTIPRAASAEPRRRRPPAPPPRPRRRRPPPRFEHLRRARRLARPGPPAFAKKKSRCGRKQVASKSQGRDCKKHGVINPGDEQFIRMAHG